MQPVTSERAYVVGAGPVTLDVTIGEGQLGTAAVVIDGHEVVRGSGRVHADLGDGAALRGRTLKVFARVSHTNPGTTRCSVSYDWAGGPAPQADFDDGDFGVNGDPAKFVATYHLA